MGAAASPWRRRDWGLLFLAALGLRVLAALLLDGFRHPGLNEYEDIARSLVAGRGYSFYHLGVWYRSFAAPLFGWISAGVYWLGGSVGVVVALQMIVSSAHCVLIARMAETLFRHRLAGLAAGALMAVHPGLIVYASAKAHDLTFDAFFFSLVLWLSWRLHEQPSLARAIALGCAVGVGAHSRGTTVIFLPIAGAWLLLRHARTDWRLMAGRWLVAAVCAVAVITPWATRNILIHRAFVWMLTTDAESLWDGNNPNATGHSYATPNLIVLDTLPPELYREMRSQPTELAQSRWFQRQAMNFITEHPGQAFKLLLWKFYSFWWFSPQSGTIYARSWLEIYRAFYAGLLVLAVFGARAMITRGDPDRRWDFALLALFLLALSVLQSVYYVEVRHRWAIEPLLLIVSGGGLAWLLQQWEGRRRA